MRWITREKVKVDRVIDCPVLDACPIRAVGDDVSGCWLGHHGEAVSLDAILTKYGLTRPALALLAQIVRAADCHPSDPHPAGEGLRWVAHGFSALGLSDPEILEQEFIVYDALCAECGKRGAA
jgi:hypothetical protein